MSLIFIHHRKWFSVNSPFFFAGNLSDKMNASKERSLSIKKELDSLVIPDFADNYLCNTSLENNIKNIINSGKKITIGLGKLKGMFPERIKKSNLLRHSQL